MSQNGDHKSSGRRWKVGFVNCAGKSPKYLTEESFREVNVTGTALKKKQIWSLEQVGATTYIRSPQGRYVTCDKYGKVMMDEEGTIPEGHGFMVKFNTEGKWAFEHEKLNLFFGCKGEEAMCCDKTPKDSAELNYWWNIQLYVHPQINLRNLQRTRYAHLNEKTAALECTEIVPWGADAVITLEFADGKYSLKSCDNKYLAQDGSLQDELDDKAQFTLEIHSGCLAFKDKDGRYLTAVGTGPLQSKGKTVNKDTMFTIEDSHPQVQIVSQNGEGKCVSVKQGLDVSANQPKDLDGIEDTEIFQMEHDKDTDTWSFVTYDRNVEKYWTLKGEPGTIQIVREKNKNSQFTVEYQPDGSVGIKGADGKYLSNRPTGILFSNTTSMDEANKFAINIVNRPILVLMGEHGFMGLKMKQIVCNTAKYDTLSVDCKGSGTYHLKASNGQYLSLDDSKTVVLDDNIPADFQFQFCGGSHLAIMEKGGNFLQGGQNGQIRAVATEIVPSSKWEF